MAVHSEFSTLIDEVLENGGGTYYLSLQRGGRLILGSVGFEDGYFVALPNREAQVTPESLEVFDLGFIIADYVAANLEALREFDQYLGFWVAPSGRLYLDVSKHINNRERAIQSGIGWGQDAIWDIKAGKEIDLRGGDWFAPFNRR